MNYILHQNPELAEAVLANDLAPLVEYVRNKVFILLIWFLCTKASKRNGETIKRHAPTSKFISLYF
jgi:hypothetical protein